MFTPILCSFCMLAITVIPCTQLSISTWRQIATTNGKHKLIAYVCDRKRCLSWFVHSAGYGFKMVIPLETILEATFKYVAPGTGLASFVLSHPPVFYLDTMCSGNPVLQEWKRCMDWTEGQQASKVLQHDLIGSAIQLAHFLCSLQHGALVPDTSPHLPVKTPNAKALVAALRTEQTSRQPHRPCEHQIYRSDSDLPRSCCLEHDLRGPYPILPTSSQPVLLGATYSPSVAVDDLVVSSDYQLLV
jgi:hypothetical protein